jgi:hypothetical protein
MNQVSEQYRSPRPETINEEFEDDERNQRQDDDTSTESNINKPVTSDKDKKLNNNKNIYDDGLCGTTINRVECILISLIIFFCIVAIAIGITFFVIIPRNDNKRLIEAALKNKTTETFAPTMAPTSLWLTTDQEVAVRYDTLRDMLNSDKYIPESLLGMPLPETFDECVIRNDYKYRFLNNWAKSVNWRVISDLQPEEPRFEYASQRFGAIMLYYQTLGHYWHNKTNWLTNSHICTWHGIICRDVVPSNNASLDGQPVDQVVVAINLTSNHLVGKLETIPFELFQDTLEHIYFSKNELVGSIPTTAIQTLPFLKTLDLSYNQIGGTIPSTLLDPINKVSNDSSSSKSSRLGTFGRRNSIPFLSIIANIR